MKKLLLMLAAMAFIAVGCTDDPLEPENPGQDGTEQTPGTGDNGEEPGENPGGENPGGENPGGEDPENPGENPEEPTLPGTEISLFDFAQLPNDDETLYRVSGVVWSVDVDENETMVILGTCLYEEDYDFDPTKDAVAGIMNPTWLKDLNPALRPGHVLTVVGNKGAFGDDPDGDAMILNSQYVSHVDYSEPYLVFDMYVKPYLGYEAGEYTFNVYSNSEWTVTAPEGTSVTPSSGNGCAEVTFKYPANANFQDAFYPVVFNYSGKTAEIKFQQEAISYSLELSENHVEVAADATTASVEVLSNGPWTVNAPEGVTATPESGNGNATVNFTFAENRTKDQINYEVNISGVNAGYNFIISQAPHEGPLPLTIAEFLKTEVSAEYYQLTGVMSGTYNTTYGNFYLEDETGKVLVYGLTATKQASNDKSFASLGLRDGDELTLIGTRADYNGTAQVGGPAYYVSHVAAPFLEFPASSASVVAEETTYTIEVQSNVNWTATASTGVTLSPASGNGNASVVMTFAANTTDAAATHTVTFVAEGIEKTFTLIQKAVATSGTPVSYTALFGSSYNSKSVSAYTETWTATNQGFKVTLANWNNNQNKWTYIKAGRKNNTSVATITTEQINEALTTVTMTVDAVTTAKINSLKLYVSSNSSFTSPAIYTASAATGNVTFNISTPVANAYYKIEVDCASGSSNGLITVSKVVYAN